MEILGGLVLCLMLLYFWLIGHWFARVLVFIGLEAIALFLPLPDVLRPPRIRVVRSVPAGGGMADRESAALVLAATELGATRVLRDVALMVYGLGAALAPWALGYLDTHSAVICFLVVGGISAMFSR